MNGKNLIHVTLTNSSFVAARIFIDGRLLSLTGNHEETLIACFRFESV